MHSIVAGSDGLRVFLQPRLLWVGGWKADFTLDQGTSVRDVAVLREDRLRYSGRRRSPESNLLAVSKRTVKTHAVNR
jgi:hypothetical protein